MLNTLNHALKTKTPIYIRTVDGDVSHGTIGAISSSRTSNNPVVTLLLANLPARQRAIAIAHIVSVTAPLTDEAPPEPAPSHKVVVL